MPVALDPKQVVIVQESVGFTQLGDPQHGWNLLDTLPAEKRGHHQVLMARLMAGTALKKWALVEDLADLLADGWLEDMTRLAGQFYMEKAGAMLAEGNVSEAGRYAQKMSKCWPQGRLGVLDDPAFVRLFE